MVEGCGEICGKQSQCMTDGRKEITGNDTLKSIVQVNSSVISFDKQRRFLNPHSALC